MQVSYLGPEGSYTNIAALEIYKNDDVELVTGNTITNIIHDLEAGVVDRAVVPIENSIAGGVAETIDALLKAEDVYVTREMVLPISHCLLAASKVDLAKVEEVKAHHMALGQCEDYIRTNLTNAEVIPSSSNSAAARDLKIKKDAGEDLSDRAVIASKLCAEIYDLEVVAEPINDASINETRFWILSKELEPIQEGKNKTTIVFQTKDEPGSLQVVLRLFAVNHVNLSRLESRPAKKSIGEYMFIIDFDLHREDKRYEELLRQAKQHFSYYKWLGSYNVDI